MDISIIILNYKMKGLAMNCIKSIREADFAFLKYEIIVVDNDSNDSIGEILAWQYPDVRFIQAGGNIGMGAGNNVGIREAVGKYIVIMNPDTIAMRNTFLVLHKYMEENLGVGIVGPKQFNPDRTVQDSCYRWHGLLTPFNRRTSLGKIGTADLDRFLMKDFDKESIREVDWLLGSFLFIRRSALDQVGLFDENFWMYFEDTDLCRRFWQKNWKVVYDPEAKIIHNHARASAKIKFYKYLFNKMTRAHIISWLKYLRKWGMAIQDSKI